MKQKKKLIKQLAALALIILIIAPQHNYCSEPELSSATTVHSLTPDHQNNS